MDAFDLKKHYLSQMIFKYSNRQWLLFFSTVIIITFIVRISIINVASIASGSMLPNYGVHNRIVVNQLSWGLNIPFLQQQVIRWNTPQRGEVILFRNPHDHGRVWLKRVIGLSGDHIEFRNHQLYINHQRCSLNKRSNEHLPRTNSLFSPSYKVWSSYLEKDWGPIEVPAGKLFLMGDNRSNSIDSRTWGSISMRHLIGKPVFRIWPLSAMAWLTE